MDHLTLITLILGLLTVLGTIIGGYAKLEGRLVKIETTITESHNIEMSDLRRRVAALEDKQIDYASLERLLLTLHMDSIKQDAVSAAAVATAASTSAKATAKAAEERNI